MTQGTVKVGITQNERWPIYRLDALHPDVVVNVPAETVERWRAAAAAYEQAQNEMDAALQRAPRS